MNAQILQNIQKFLERVTAQGAECYAWAEAHSAVVQEIQALHIAAVKATLPKPEAPPAA
jgi:hypothetical protein